MILKHDKSFHEKVNITDGLQEWKRWYIVGYSCADQFQIAIPKMNETTTWNVHFDDVVFQDKKAISKRKTYENYLNNK